MVLRKSWPFWRGSYRQPLPRERLIQFLERFTMHGFGHGYSIMPFMKAFLYKAFLVNDNGGEAAVEGSAL